MTNRPTDDEIRAAIWRARQDTATIKDAKLGDLATQPEEVRIEVEMEVREIAALIRNTVGARQQAA